MQTGNTNAGNKVTETKVISGLRIIETDVEVPRPVFRDKAVEVPRYVEKEIEVPKITEDTINSIAQKASEKITSLILFELDQKLSDAIDKRIKEIEVPQITYLQKEELTVNKKNVEVTNAIVKDKEVINAVIKDKEVLNAVVKDVPVVNAVIKDVEVKNAILEDVHVRNAVVEDVPVKNAIIKNETVIVPVLKKVPKE